MLRNSDLHCEVVVLLNDELFRQYGLVTYFADVYLTGSFALNSVLILIGGLNVLKQERPFLQGVEPEPVYFVCYKYLDSLSIFCQLNVIMCSK